jgi:putative endonuclease
MCYYVYILYSETLGKYYKGQTNDLEDRIHRHNNKQEKATSFGVPWKLVWFTEKPDRSSAVILERKLKNMSQRKTEEFITKYQDQIAGPDVAPGASQDAD